MVGFRNDVNPKMTVDQALNEAAAYERASKNVFQPPEVTAKYAIMAQRWLEWALDYEQAHLDGRL